jgi:hypothetical protein
LDLGSVLPDEGGSSVFRLAGLPHAEFTLGLEIRSLTPEEAEASFSESEAQVQLALKTAAGLVVFDQGGLLADWVWTCGVSGCRDSFAYVRGETKETPLPGGGVELELIRGAVDASWGTYFRPRKNETYELMARIRGLPTLPERVSIHAIGRGGGWK